MTVGVETKTFVRALWAAMAVMVLLGLLRDVLRSFFGMDRMGGMGPLVDLDEEYNLPTLFSVVLLLLASVAAFAACKLFSPEAVSRKWGWYLLSAGFLVMAADEFVGLHDRIGKIAKEVWGDDAFHGTFRFVWPIPALGLLIVLACIFVPFLRHLPTALRRRLCAAGAVYVVGAVGMEMVGGWYYEHVAHADHSDFGYSLLTVTEEGMEMAGVILFIATLLREVREGAGSKTLELR
ncbi:MAG TPA: hypothetical protein VFL16_07170 [Steroidobacteraceae bacterium]|nr:hypothetical protein [Steroidobacteraceae bacterium]